MDANNTDIDVVVSETEARLSLGPNVNDQEELLGTGNGRIEVIVATSESRQNEANAAENGGAQTSEPTPRPTLSEPDPTVTSLYFTPGTSVMSGSGGNRGRMNFVPQGHGPGNMLDTYHDSCPEWELCCESTTGPAAGYTG